jgi:hypothetical protein
MSSTKIEAIEGLAEIIELASKDYSYMLSSSTTADRLGKCLLKILLLGVYR